DHSVFFQRDGLNIAGVSDLHIGRICTGMHDHIILNAIFFIVWQCIFAVDVVINVFICDLIVTVRSILSVAISEIVPGLFALLYLYVWIGIYPIHIHVIIYRWLCQYRFAML